MIDSAMDAETIPSLDQRRDLHGGDYAKRFLDQKQSGRLRGLAGRLCLPPDAVVADYGCGPGFMLDLIGDRIGHYYGVDFSADFIEIACARSKPRVRCGAEFVLSTIEDFSATHAGKVDVALAMDISEHVPDEEWRTALRAIRRSLKPGGALYLHTPNAGFILEIMKEAGILLRQSPEHIAIRAMTANIDMLESAGFKIRQADFIPHYNVLKHLHSLTVCPLVGRYFAARIFIGAVNPPQRAG